MDIEEIKAGLKQPGKSRAGLARCLGVDVSQISRLLNGKRQLKVSEVPIIRKYLYGDAIENGVTSVRLEDIVHNAQLKLVNLEIISDLLDEAERCGLDASQTIANALREAITTKRSDDWLRQNKGAIQRYNEFIARYGLLTNRSRGSYGSV